MVIKHITMFYTQNVAMWNLLSFIQGKTRRHSLEELSLGPKTPTKISQSINANLSHVSRALGELEEKKLVECLTPEVTKNRIYRITEKGTALLAEYKKLQ